MARRANRGRDAGPKGLRGFERSKFRSTLNLAINPLRHFLQKCHLPLPRGARQEEAFAFLQVFQQIYSCRRAEQSPAPTKSWANSYCSANFERRAFLPQVLCPEQQLHHQRDRQHAQKRTDEHAGGRDVYLIFEPMAAALGIGLDVEAPKGHMVVDIGGGTTEIAVISLGGLVQQDSIRVAGDVFTSDIQYYLRQQHNIKVGESTAEKIKWAVGSVLSELEDEPAPYIVNGPNIMTAHPVEATITYQEIAHCLDKSIAKIETSIMHVLEMTPPELYSDIIENGIYLSGGGALLRGLAKRLTDKVNIKFIVAEDPLHAVARGTCKAIKNTDKYKFLMR